MTNEDNQENTKLIHTKFHIYHNCLTLGNYINIKKYIGSDLY